MCLLEINYFGLVSFVLVHDASCCLKGIVPAFVAVVASVLADGKQSQSNSAQRQQRQYGVENALEHKQEDQEQSKHHARLGNRPRYRLRDQLCKAAHRAFA
eukprot:CAMPEP_0114285880 /NCGR_PEP_ID=MMETSP0059-20121206/5447_1 /TAXON_ID=36894 /ORGANISM="Pyramimonas parkeae, Strain CCMP726" /LENGTH=100 /DNA_ID=CAMNT_0001406857 /DNA_START=366 /DNA_END=668 /DNA_ORIENTATION=+